MIVLQMILAIGAVLYLIAALLIRIGLSRLDSTVLTSNQPLVSVLVPARNEEENIRNCLHSIFKQDYPNFDVIVINDNSLDRTFEIAMEFSSKPNFRILDMQQTPDGIAPKKAAIELGVKMSPGEFIVTTDADCIVPKSWLSSLVSQFDDKTGAVLSWLQVENDNRYFTKVESLDSLFYSFIGAGLVGIGKPTIANGANFAYRKKVFQELNGFAGQQQYASGDDDLFLQKLTNQKKWKIRFQPCASARVTTTPVKNIHEFISQRLRWASKGPIYPNTILFIQIGLYLFFLSLLTSFVILFFQPQLFWFFGISFFSKIIADWIIFSSGKKYIHYAFNARLFFALEILQILYILFVGVGGLWGQFTWKGRKFTHGKVKERILEAGDGRPD